VSVLARSRATPGDHDATVGTGRRRLRSRVDGRAVVADEAPRREHGRSRGRREVIRRPRGDYSTGSRVRRSGRRRSSLVTTPSPVSTGRYPTPTDPQWGGRFRVRPSGRGSPEI
jgi:hypothetical protein